MKFNSVLGVVTFGMGMVLLAQPASADTEAQARKKMMASCKQEYADTVQGKTLDQLDQWAESSEQGPGAEKFKQSRCFKSHEKWEKLAQKNEWAPNTAEPGRLPASKK